MSSVKYIWTRFDFENNHLIVKIKHGLDKTEFGIPIMDFCVKNENNWLWAFYRMLREANSVEGFGNQTNLMTIENNLAKEVAEDVVEDAIIDAI